METTFPRWGRNTVLQEFERGTKQSKVKVLTIKPEQNISYQTHAKRAELWTILSGSGTFVQDGKFYEISQGDSVHIPVGSKHAIKAGKNGIEIIEVQFGDQCSEEDIDRIHMAWSDIQRFAGEEV